MEQVVHKVLHCLVSAAECDDEQARARQLRQLFDDVCAEIEPDVRASDVLEADMPPCRFYYEGIAWFLARGGEGKAPCRDDDGEKAGAGQGDRGWDLARELLPLFTCMWDISDVRRTFALTMHRYASSRISTDL